jgi:hypothetical protein
MSPAPACDGLADAALQDCLAHFPQVRLRVSGACMEPGLAEGSAVILEPAANRPPRWGDVVLVRHRPAPGSGAEPAPGLRLHRLVWCPPALAGWRTQADRARSVDPRIGREDILATAVAVPGSSQDPRNRTRALLSLARAILARMQAFFPG